MNEKVLQLMELDRCFCAESQKIGLKAWINRFAEQGVMVNAKGKLIVGKEDLKNALTPLFALRSLNFKWEPAGGHISDDGTLGYTYGDYIRTYLDPAGAEKIDTGRYTTIWRAVEGDKWEIELDIGN